MADPTGPDRRGFATDAIHVGQEPDPVTGAVIPPPCLTSTYAQTAVGVHRGYEYGRGENPTREAYEKNLAALEGGRHGIAFASGLAAVDAVLALLDAGDHVVLTENVYGGTYRLLDRVRSRHGLTFTRAPTHDLDAVRAALRPATKLLLVETPTNPTLEISDLGALATLCRGAGVLFAVDNTFLTPYFQRPLEHGADLVLHSATKYLNGHSDVIGGIVAVRDADLAERLRFLQMAVGAVPGPFDCWLVTRGIKTLAIRMERHESNARRLVERFAGHPRLRTLLYPGLPDHPQHDLACRQMSGFGGMIACDLGSREAARIFLESVRVFTLAESLGGVESLISLPAEMSHAAVPAEDRLRQGITPGLVRISVGIEDCDDLAADLEQALAAVPPVP